MARWKAHVEFLLSVIELLFPSLTVEALQGKMSQNLLPSGGVGHLEPRFQGEGVVPLPTYWYYSKVTWLRYISAADSFYIMKLCSRLFVLYCRNCSKDHKFSHFIPILRKLGAVSPWLMARWKPMLKCTWTSFYLLRLRRYKAKCIKTRCLQEGVGHLEPRFQGGSGRPLGNIFWFLQN